LAPDLVLGGPLAAADAVEFVVNLAAGRRRADDGEWQEVLACDPLGAGMMSGRTRSTCSSGGTRPLPFRRRSMMLIALLAVLGANLIMIVVLVWGGFIPSVGCAEDRVPSRSVVQRPRR
jgi:hypothetical protein